MNTEQEFSMGFIAQELSVQTPDGKCSRFHRHCLVNISPAIVF